MISARTGCEVGKRFTARLGEVGEVLVSRQADGGDFYAMRSEGRAAKAHCASAVWLVVRVKA